MERRNKPHIDCFSFDVWTAASLGNLSSLKKQFFTKGKALALVNEKNKGGWTPLMYASYYGHGPVVQFLLQIGASVACLSNSRKTPLMMAAMAGNDNCASLLLQHGAKVDDQDSTGWTALMHAASYGYQNVIHILIAHGADVNKQCSPDNITALMIASESGHLDVVRILLEAGANAQLMSTSNHSAYSEGGHKNIISVLDSNYQGSRIHCGPQKVQELINSVAPTVKGLSSPSRMDPVGNLKTVLSSIGLEEYFELLKSKNIDIHQFLKLTADDLKAFGVVKIGPRSKMANVIKKINAQHFDSSPRFKQPMEVPSYMKHNEIPKDTGCVCKPTPDTEVLKTALCQKQILSIKSPATLTRDLITLQQKMEHMVCITGMLKELCSNFDHISQADYVKLSYETNSLAKDIYRDLKTVLGNLNDHSYK